MDYSEFLTAKSQLCNDSGFKPLWMPDFLFDFQAPLVERSLLKGRAAIFCSPGMGKTPMQLVYAQNVVQKTNKPSLILTPLGVSAQTVREAEKFGIEAERSKTGKFKKKIVITNFQNLHKFDRNDFSSVICDDAAVMKNFNGVYKGEITEFMREIQYRLLCTATPAPNDYIELGTLSEALGELGYMDMLGMFFKNDQNTSAPMPPRQCAVRKSAHSKQVAIQTAR